MTDAFSIEIWSDIVCPFCYLGSRQLANALESFDHRDAVVVTRRAFELDPTTPRDVATSLAQLVADKYDMPVERAEALNQRLESQALILDMTWSMATAKPTNTFDAHRLLALASRQGLGDAMSERLFAAYFSEGLLISDYECLSELARRRRAFAVGVGCLLARRSRRRERRPGTRRDRCARDPRQQHLHGARCAGRRANRRHPWPGVGASSGLVLLLAGHHCDGRHGVTIVEVHHANASGVSTLG